MSRRLIEVVDYRPEWTAAFEREKDLLVRILRNNGQKNTEETNIAPLVADRTGANPAQTVTTNNAPLVASDGRRGSFNSEGESLPDGIDFEIHHIGSTSVKGLAAKPIIDILIITDSLEALDARDAAMIGAGYTPRGEYGIPGRRYYQKNEAPDQTNEAPGQTNEAPGQTGEAPGQLDEAPEQTGEAKRTHHIHAFLRGSLNCERHLAFRDYLRVHRQVAREYETLKRRNAAECNNSSQNYCDLKNDFVQEVQKKALQWRARHRQAIKDGDFRIVEISAPDQKSEIGERILRSVPEWFGIEEAVVNYVREIRDMETLAAVVDDDAIGFVSLHKPNPFTAEIHVMGLLPHCHGRGVGRLMCEHAEYSLAKQGFRFIQVKTLSPSRECFGYEKTRKFYESMGFCPLEEFKTLWGEANPCLQMIKCIEPQAIGQPPQHPQAIGQPPQHPQAIGQPPQHPQAIGQPPQPSQPPPQPSPGGSLDHIEIYVADLKRSTRFWSWLLCDVLSYRVFQEWEGGQSYILGETYVVLVQAERRFLGVPYHRCRPGLNHLAFKADSKTQIDEITAELEARGITILYRDRHPHAGGDDYYAVFFEDPERIKVEVVFREE